MVWVESRHRYDALVQELRTLATSKEGDSRLQSLRAQAAGFLTDPGWLWPQLILAFSTLQARGDANWKRAKALLPSAQYAKYAALADKESRIEALSHDLKTVGYRFPNRTYGYLAGAIQLMAARGGPAAAVEELESATDQKKIDFLRKFPGISSKYARNIWMDVDPSALYRSFAIDSNLQRLLLKIHDQTPRGLEAGNISDALYSDAESRLARIADAAYITCWEADRLMYGFNNRLMDAILAVKG